MTLPNGPYLAEGTIVGIHPWIVHLDEKVYGSDTGEFRPERWLPKDGEKQEDFDPRRQAMRETELTYGAGDRVCLGKTIAVVEIYKLIATLFLLFEVGNNPTVSWKCLLIPVTVGMG